MHGSGRRVGTAPAVVLALVLGVAACGTGGRATATPGTILVVATTTQLADFVRVVGGDRVVTVGLLKPNVDAHEYEPSPADIDRIQHARVIVRNGLGLDGWVDKAIAASGTRGTVVDASAGLTPRVERGAPDPHVWMDPRNAGRMVRDVVDALALADPAGAAGYRERGDAYGRQLDALDAELLAELAPLSNRKVVTNHDAFHYFLDRYGLTYVGSVIPSFDTQAELSAAELKGLVDRIRAQGVTVIFTETSLPPKTARAVAQEAGVRVVTGAGALYGDSLGPPGSGADTYLTMMRTDARTFAENLR